MKHIIHEFFNKANIDVFQIQQSTFLNIALVFLLGLEPDIMRTSLIF